MPYCPYFDCCCRRLSIICAICSCSWAIFVKPLLRNRLALARCHSGVSRKSSSRGFSGLSSVDIFCLERGGTGDGAAPGGAHEKKGRPELFQGPARHPRSLGSAHTSNAIVQAAAAQNTRSPRTTFGRIMASSKSNECWAGPGWWINRSPHGFRNVHIPQAATTRYMQGAGLVSIIKFWTVTLLIAPIGDTRCKDAVAGLAPFCLTGRLAQGEPAFLRATLRREERGSRVVRLVPHLGYLIWVVTT